MDQKLYYKQRPPILTLRRFFYIMLKRKVSPMESRPYLVPAAVGGFELHATLLALTLYCSITSASVYHRQSYLQVGEELRIFCIYLRYIENQFCLV